MHNHQRGPKLPVDGNHPMPGLGCVREFPVRKLTRQEFRPSSFAAARASLRGAHPASSEWASPAVPCPPYTSRTRRSSRIFLPRSSQRSRTKQPRIIGMGHHGQNPLLRKIQSHDRRVSCAHHPVLACSYPTAPSAPLILAEYRAAQRRNLPASTPHPDAA